MTAGLRTTTWWFISPDAMTWELTVVSSLGWFQKTQNSSVFFYFGWRHYPDEKHSVLAFRFQLQLPSSSLLSSGWDNGFCSDIGCSYHFHLCWVITIIDVAGLFCSLYLLLNPDIPDILANVFWTIALSRELICLYHLFTNEGSALNFSSHHLVLCFF